MQKMSEKEAIEWLKAISAVQNTSIHKNSLLERKEALHMAIQAIEEIQSFKKAFPDLTDEDIKITATCLEELLQYRAIGTVSEVKYLIDSYNDIIHDFGDDMDLLEQYKAIGTVEELQKSVKEEDVLKFYYIESEDKYVIGKRVGNFYYADYGKTGFTFYMSRYLPWGQHVVSPNTLWKEHTYCSEPKEISFFEWLQGFIKKECGGSLEECREAAERMKPKKAVSVSRADGIIRFFPCPHCSTPEKYVQVYPKQKHCVECGGSIDWSE